MDHIQLGQQASARVAVDIGSTVVKVARLGIDGELLEQAFHPRDFDAGIAAQVGMLLDGMDPHAARDEVLVCSSANGGLRVGIVSLTSHFSGAISRNQVLLAGANPVFVRTLDEEGQNLAYVDMLIVAGGIDCPDAGVMQERLMRFKPDDYRYGALVYAGNKHLAGLFTQLFPHALAIPNPLAEGLSGRSASVFDTVRTAYLDDLIYKEGVSELNASLSHGIRPTPEVVNRGFHRAMLNASSLRVVAPCVLCDIGGATTDLHYTVELVRDESDERPPAGISVARYVFTDLGIVASRDTLLMQLRAHTRLYEFLAAVLDSDVRETYRSLREGEYDAQPALLSYGCLFLALDRFVHGRGRGLPAADFGKLAQIILTGGAAHGLQEAILNRVVRLLLPEGNGDPAILIDRQYRIWVDGITWAEPRRLEHNFVTDMAITLLESA